MKKITLLFLLLILMTGCSERVPNGYKGMIREKSGMTGQVLEPGRHICYGYDVMTLISEAEKRNIVPLKVLIQEDNVNFQFNLVIRFTPILDNNGYNFFIKKLGSKIREGNIQGDDYYYVDINDIYTTFVRDIAVNSARTIVSSYPIRSINKNREEIDAKISKLTIDRLKGLPIKITMIVSSNYDFPDEIESANELALKRKVDIETEKANQALKLMKLENRVKLAEKKKRVSQKEAEADGIYMKVMGNYLSNNYLRLKALNNQAILYEKVGTGDKVITEGANPQMLIKGN